MSEEKITMVGLTEEEQRIFLELRRIAMRAGSVTLHYNIRGVVIDIQENRHNYRSGGIFGPLRKKLSTY